MRKIGALVCLVVPLFSTSLKAESGTATGPRKVLFTLNIDFFDLAKDYQTRNSKPNAEYPLADYEALLENAAANGFKRLYYRIGALGDVAYPTKLTFSSSPLRTILPAVAWGDYKSTLTKVHPLLAQTIAKYDPVKETLRIAKLRGMEVYLWLTPLDDAGDGPTDGKIGVGQSQFSFYNPQFQLQSQTSSTPNWGVYCFGHPQVKQYWYAQIDELIRTYKLTKIKISKEAKEFTDVGIAGVFFDDRTHSNKYGKLVDYIYNEPFVGKTSGYDRKTISERLGGFYTEFLTNASRMLREKNLKVHVKASWSNDYRASYRFGLTREFLHVSEWAKRGLFDNLIIGGDEATKDSDEFTIDSYDSFSPINDPSHFPRNGNTVERWLGLFNWSMNDPMNIRYLEGASSTAKQEVIREAVLQIVRSGVDGIAFNEALVIESHKDWAFFGELARLKDIELTRAHGSPSASPSETEANASREEIAAWLAKGVRLWPEASFDALIDQAYRKVRQKGAGIEELRHWRTRLRRGLDTDKTMVSHLAIVQAYLNVRGSTPTQNEIQHWVREFRDRTRDQGALTQTLLIGSANGDSDQLSAVVQRAYLTARGARPATTDIAARTKEIRERKIGYAHIVGSLIQQTRSWSFETMQAFVNRASLEALGTGYVPTVANDKYILIAQAEGYAAVVEAFGSTSRASKAQRDAVINRAYQAVLGHDVDGQKREVWRAYVRRGQANYQSIVNALRR